MEVSSVQPYCLACSCLFVMILFILILCISSPCANWWCSYWPLNHDAIILSIKRTMSPVSSSEDHKQGANQLVTITSIIRKEQRPKIQTRSGKSKVRPPSMPNMGHLLACSMLHFYPNKNLIKPHHHGQNLDTGSISMIQLPRRVHSSLQLPLLTITISIRITPR